MNFRIPSWSELVGLFLRSHAVDSIVSGITAQIDRLEAAVDHHHTKAGDHYAAAAIHNEAGDDHAEEANRAVVVSGKLTALISA